jgi:outer membrane protein assembly factor BamB
MKNPAIVLRQAGALVFLLLPMLEAGAADWPGFRGPNASGVGEAVALPVEFGPATNVIWKTLLPQGKSSPVLANDRIFLTAQEGGELFTLCLDRETGKVLWRRSLRPERSEKLHQLNSPASATPATDGRNVYVFFGDFGLISYGPDGEERWRYALGPFTNLQGMGASPIVVDGKVVIVCDQDENSYVLAIDKDTGKIVWKTDRPEVVHGFATPNVWRPENGGAQLIVPGSYVLISYSLETGEKLWWVRGLTWQVKPSAVAAGETIYVTGGAPGVEPGERLFFPPFEEAVREADADGDHKISQAELPEKWKPNGSWRAIDLDIDGFLNGREWTFYRARRGGENATLAVRPGNARGDLTDSHVLWRYDRAVPIVSSPLLYENILYTIKDGGILTSLDPATGKVLKSARVRDAIDNYYASPVAADGKIYLASETGKISVIRPGAQWEVLAVHDFEEPAYASPAISDGRLYVRTDAALYAFGEER